MGVPAQIVVYSESESKARDAAAVAFARIAELEQIMSDYRPDSELLRLCSAPAGTPHPISPDLLGVLMTSQRVAAVSGGAFDVTLGPAVALWRSAVATHQPPTAESLHEARARCGSELLRLDPVARTATLARPGMRLDLGGIGKGYAAQQAVELLCDRGHPRCLVGLAGDIVVGDPPPESPGWVIQLPTGRSVTLRSAAISTSGATEQFVEIGGVRYAHILDPRTGLGLTSCPTVTVIAPRGELSDSLATAACILGPERAGPLLDRFGARIP